MRSDEGLRRLLDLMLEMAYAPGGGAATASPPQRNAYIGDCMEVHDEQVYEASRVLDQDAWHVVNAHNKRLWLPPAQRIAMRRTCYHNWIKVCSTCGDRYEFRD